MPAAQDQTTPEMLFAGNLRLFREQKGWSQSELAKQMSDRGFRWYAATVYSVEKGERKIPLNEAVALAAALDQPLEVLLSEPEAGLDLRELLTHMAYLEKAIEDAGKQLQGLASLTSMLEFWVDMYRRRGVVGNSQAARGTIERRLADASDLIARADELLPRRDGEHPEA